MSTSKDPASVRDDVVRIASGEVGKPYATHRDCSGFTAWVYRQVGVNIPEGSEAQRHLGSDVGSAAQAGDLCFWATPTGHVGLADGKGGIINALNENAGIVVTPQGGSYGGAFQGCRNILDDTTDPKDGDHPPKDHPKDGKDHKKKDKKKDKKKERKNRGKR